MDTVSASCDDVGTSSRVRHLVIILQENHTFDNHFGRYCTAPPGSAPTCHEGPGCCEAGPDREPSGAWPVLLDDAAHGAFSPDHSMDCEVAEINGGAMNRFVSGVGCAHPSNFAYADLSLMKPYWDLADQYALADRYFQPIAGASSANNMVWARARYVFTDNAYEPAGAVGAACTGATLKSYQDPTLGDLLREAGVPWAFYAEGYQDMASLEGSCPSSPPADCPAALVGYPCTFDPGDIPFEYYDTLRDQPDTMRDLRQLSHDLAAGMLPAVSFVKFIGYKTEHPGDGSALSTGVQTTKALVDHILSSSIQDEVLVVLTYDEGGGYFDHIAPPPDSQVDGKPYGTRVPMLAMGPFARKHWVSHVTMEHSSVVRFIEWNWLGGETGQLGGRDATVNGMGSLLDPAATGVPVPE